MKMKGPKEKYFGARLMDADGDWLHIRKSGLEYYWEYWKDDSDEPIKSNYWSEWYNDRKWKKIILSKTETAKQFLR